MKTKIGFICVGQAGGNIGTLFESKGFNVFYINTSQEDISTLKGAKHTFHIPNSEGCNKDREKALKVLTEHIDELEEQAKRYMEQQEIIYFIFSLGGGSGGGFTPMYINLLTEEIFRDNEGNRTKDVGIITIFPNDSESPKTRDNAYNCYREIQNLPDIKSKFFLDNNSYEDKLTINKIFVDIFSQFLEIPEKHKSIKGNIDRAEMTELFRTEGTSVIIMLGNKKSKTSDIIQTLKSNIFAPVETSEELRRITYIASSTIEPLDYQAIKSEFGIYQDEFHTFNQECNLVMLTGLSSPVTRVKKMRDDYSKDLQNIKRNIIKNDIVEEEIESIDVIRKEHQERKKSIVNNKNNSDDLNNNVVKSMSTREQLLNRFKKK